MRSPKSSAPAIPTLGGTGDLFGRFDGPTTLTQLTVAEAAARIGVSTRVIHLRIKAGLIPTSKLPGATGAYLLDPALMRR
jgi:hypothetical protein